MKIFDKIFKRNNLLQEKYTIILKTQEKLTSNQMRQVRDIVNSGFEEKKKIYEISLDIMKATGIYKTICFSKENNIIEVWF